MTNLPSPGDVVYRLLAASWAPQDLPTPEEIPWPVVLSFVGPTNLAGSLHVIVESLRYPVPPDIKQILEAAYYRTIAANVRCLEQLSQVGTALSHVRTPVMLLKGAALLDTVYKSLALRSIGDIDLVVPVTSVSACRQVLLDLGYIPEEIEARQGTQIEYRAEEQFRPPHPLQAPVELHWHLLDVPYYRNKLPMDWFWQNSETRMLAGQPFQVLNTVASLIYLPAHLALHHRYRQLHSLLDLALLIVASQKSLDWTAIITAARSFELASALQGTLDRLAECWPTLPLAEPRHLLAAAPPSRADARLHRLLTLEAPSTSLNIYTALVSLPNATARTRYVWDNVFPQASYMIKRYGVRARWMLLYWYLYRFFMGLVRFARAFPRAWWFDRRNK